MPPPFRADQVGSLLRPAILTEARARFKRGALPQAELRRIEDAAVREVIAQQESLGLQSITDGEFRRDWWHLDFMSRLDGVTVTENPGPKFGKTEEQPPIAAVTGKVRYTKPIMIDDFKFLKAHTQGTAKFTIPSPSMLHLRGGRSAISRAAYPSMQEFWADLAAAYRDVLAKFAAAGCTYLQLDDVAFAYLCDNKVRENCRKNGDDPEALPRIYADTLNAALAQRPAGMTVTMHTCRGNFKSSWVAEGGYEAVAEAMFSTAVDAFFMEFDSDRAGTFDPLRYLPRNKQVVLGLVSSKVRALESKESIKRRIDAAAKYVPLEQLCLSPQCGFSSTHHGNDLSLEEQWAKLRLVVEVAHDVWGSP
ncbi:MAG TPA: 5-methyltetrahydropteroyltriglutamate--homocysteine S-methyltransferase [Steroidobacteraceae bacterium]